MKIVFSSRTFIFGLPLNSTNPVESALANFILAEGKQAIYKTRKAKLLANTDADYNVLTVFKALAVTRLRAELCFHQNINNLELFKKKCCHRNDLCKVDHNDLIISF